jgi:hypothetical protein
MYFKKTSPAGNTTVLQKQRTDPMGNKKNDGRHKNEINVMVLQAWDHRSGGRHSYWMKQKNILFPMLLNLPDYNAMKI